MQTAPPDVGERILLLPPHGPFIIELRVSIDGHPLREPREELVSEMLQLADRNHDGRSTWGEVFADPKRIFGLPRNDALKLANRRDFMKANDSNRNGLVDRDEARRFVTAVKSSQAALSIESVADFYASGARQSIVRKLLDADDDGVLDRGELTALERRVLSRDANDDRIITWPELDDSLVGDELADARRKLMHRDDPVALPLGPRANWDDVEDAIQRSYLTGQAELPSESWLTRLDTDADGQLSALELRGLDAIEPDVLVGVALQENEQTDTARRLSLESLSPRMRRLDARVPEQIALRSRSPNFRVRFIIDDRGAANDRWASADTQLAALDANSNGYLEQNEAAGAFDAKTFGEIDANADGKIQLPELTSYWANHRAPKLSGVYALVLYEQDVVLSLLDMNHDGRLTTRELRGGTSLLAGFDADGDGRITADEIPETLVVVLGRGRPSEQPLLAGMTRSAGEAAPAWFKHMDANGDMEIDRDEFPGSSERFRALDRDEDGFVTPDEAHRAMARE